MTIGVLSPHRDDAAFSVSLAIDFWLRSGYQVAVLNCFTRSHYAPFALSNFTSAEGRLDHVMSLRSGEDYTWRRQFCDGLMLMELDLDDAPLRLGISLDEVCRCPLVSREDTALRIEDGLRQTGADALVVPLALGDHIDHLTTREVAIAGVSPDMPCAFYEDLPYAARPGAARKIEKAVLGLQQDLTPTFVCESSGSESPWERKFALAQCYPTQIDGEVAGQIADFCLRYGGRERLWANAAWQASELSTSMSFTGTARS